VNALYSNTTINPTGARIASLKAWWIGLIVNQGLSIREKLTLFWTDHFVTQMSTVNDPRYSYRYNALLRHNVLGNFKDMANAITQDGAMLIYLNGTNNVKTGPDENYGRELQELFTIGKGPLVGPGDYTNYTEADVKAAAHILTGWRKNQNVDTTIGTQTGYFDSTRHDTTDKTFSADYNNTIIKGGTDGQAELTAMLAMIFSQTDPDGVNKVARFISRKFYRWLVYYVIDANAEANVITPMANLISSNNFNVLPALSALLKSAHFFDPVNMGCFIKSPIDFIAALIRQFSIPIISTDVTKQYATWYTLAALTASMDQDIGEPPNVAGWQAYYQNPEYYELWINSDTLPKRRNLSDALIGNGYNTSGGKLQIDPIAFVKTLSDPTDPNVIVNEASQFLFAVTPTATQTAFLKETLLPGLPDYEWTTEWAAYLADPTNAAKLSAVKGKLQALLALLMEMPEYQLS
jgi:uncharacterized protein (DUF1800 family)